MKWYELAINPQVMTSLYTEIPALQGRQVLRILLHDEKPGVSLIADVRGQRGQDEKPGLTLDVDIVGLPDKAPERWQMLGYNVVQLSLGFREVEAVRIRGWECNNVVDMTIEQMSNGKIAVEVRSSSCQARFLAQTFTIGVEGYRNQLWP